MLILMLKVKMYNVFGYGCVILFFYTRIQMHWLVSKCFTYRYQIICSYCFTTEINKQAQEI